MHHRRDHCRIGSLENQKKQPCPSDNDHCRIGSLERTNNNYLLAGKDHCRIGSLESKKRFKSNQ